MTSGSEIHVPIANPFAEFMALQSDIEAAINGVLRGGVYILGPHVKKFETEFAHYVGTKHCIGVGNGTDALALALRACGIGPGDEVISVSHTAVATIAAIEQAGATAVLCDIEAASRCIDPNRISALVSSKTKAIVPVHIYGQPANMDEIASIAKTAGLAVIEDCAQSHGGRYRGRMCGTMGSAAAFSFYPTKNLGAIGDGGAIVTDSAEIAERCNALRQYGWKERYVSSSVGYNSRLDEMQAAILSAKLKHLDALQQRRSVIAQRYRQACAGRDLTSPAEIKDTVHAMHLFVVETEERERFRDFLSKRGIQTGLHYPQAVHQQPAYRGRMRGGDRLPVTDALYARLVTLPLFPQLSDDQVERVCSALKEWS